MKPELASELLAAAEMVADAHPAAAELLRWWSEMGPPDPRRLRRRALWRIWRAHHAGMPRTAAARLISEQWQQWQPSRRDLPGSIGAEFAAMDRAGIKPLRWRRIAEDLDIAGRGGR